ncbi:MAG: hypothetical protein CLLPBCKN_006853 [Chroococcidiopsis cubana SAG 39.79]|uniref:Phage tail protein n=1 Tax=Chroococcidiopsis cubana SAG 39.79 TaxID=388085 RepID=A0AB37UIL5_9CYAN|nr:phage tail protein [Chroococcidiopsis cubana]MDZ4877418.1 hypothetical protein [Chroococcidiopsis cubana SAG 39.79]PSB59543.1 phage tail protein [Chroococcidiopsis cubana CCALA 043]RUT11242.1 hypothetical protein DSM107010_35110 [Chroococcidiopsis cubana SAG 39.79]
MEILNPFQYTTAAQNFSVDLTFVGSQQPVDATFLACEGLNSTQDVIEICEVTPELWGAPRNKGRVIRTKLPGNIKYSNFSLLRGSSKSYAFWNWIQLAQDGNWSECRLDASVIIYDPSRKRIAQFDLSRAWPANYEISNLNSRSQDLLVESLEVAFEGFRRVEP